MKKIFIFLLTLFAFVVSLQAQEVKSNPTFTFTVPSGTLEVSEHEFLSFSKSNFEYAELLGTADNLFRNGNMLLSFKINKEMFVPDQILLSKERQWKYILSKINDTKVISSSINSYANVAFLVIKYKHGTDHLIKFVSQPNGKAEAVYGHLKYQANDSAAAEVFLQGILDSFKYN
jgi:hypothetical protein